VPFHVEIRHSLRRARVFNLSEERLRIKVVGPWRQGGLMQLGDHEWDPSESELRILEGPELGQSQLALGRGWSNAERSAIDVTAQVIREAAAEALLVAVLAETEDAHNTAVRLLDQIGIRTTDWAPLRARIDAAQFSQVVALLLVERVNPTSAWLFEAGLALGALGGRAVVAQLGDEPPPAELRDLDLVRLRPEEPASLQALADRLRHAGAPA
jgi:hypothetical protein